MYNDNEQPKSKVREKIDTIIINNAYGISDIIINALSQNGFEIDIININEPYGPQKQEINIYRVK